MCEKARHKSTNSEEDEKLKTIIYKIEQHTAVIFKIPFKPKRLKSAQCYDITKYSSLRSTTLHTMTITCWHYTCFRQSPHNWNIFDPHFVSSNLRTNTDSNATAKCVFNLNSEAVSVWIYYHIGVLLILRICDGTSKFQLFSNRGKKKITHFKYLSVYIGIIIMRKPFAVLRKPQKLK